MVKDVTAREALEALQSDPGAVLVDVRTNAEWAYVGLPDLSAAGKQPVLVAWQVFPAMQQNPHFLSELRAAGVTPGHSIYFLCRSGVRSTAAAEAAIGAGFPNAYNIADGFEGTPDARGHRGTTGGWKALGLPWRQR